MSYFLLALFILSLIITAIVKRYAFAKHILDVPNHRSSHVIPTPRGGGIAFVLSFMFAILFMGYLGLEPMSLGKALLGAGLLVAGLGFVDDYLSIPALSRLLGHFAASLFALYCLGGMPAISLLGWIIPSGWCLNILALFYLVWLINLYNFMDGIDGLASIEAISVCLGVSFIYGFEGQYALMGLPLALAASVLGFLWWNFPPARIFMGDAGSGFLGLILGILSIHAASVKPHFFWVWFILLGVFIVDASVTLLRRLVQGMKIYEAHADHAYQHAARDWGRHLWVTMGVLAINLFWLFPMALLVDRSVLSASVGVCIAYLPILFLVIRFKAGVRSHGL